MNCSRYISSRIGGIRIEALFAVVVPATDDRSPRWIIMSHRHLAAGVTLYREYPKKYSMLKRLEIKHTSFTDAISLSISPTTFPKFVENDTRCSSRKAFGLSPTATESYLRDLPLIL